ncbi:unnamed protein product [Sphenostylis stenocarpa]|uniref:Uncharacterized protein n=1 Tax=Sphenostylis stenocarpa TaxID=92480 RepID=A0AA86VRU8_9FABA|nr:unnamed protein product [Sphenostylis stenocarpa]
MDKLEGVNLLRRQPWEIRTRQESRILRCRHVESEVRNDAMKGWDCIWVLNGSTSFQLYVSGDARDGDGQLCGPHVAARFPFALSTNPSPQTNLN